MNWVLLQNSFLVSASATLLALTFGFLAALWANGLERRARRVAFALAILALAMPPFLATNSWLHFLGDTGVWRRWLPFNIFTLPGAVWILALLTWPITFFGVLASWQTLEAAQLESDPALEGWNLIRRLFLPVVRPALLQAAAITFVLTLNNFAVPALLQVKVFPAETWVRFNTTFDAPGSFRLGWPLILLPLIVLFWLGRRTVDWPRLEGAVPAHVWKRQVGSAWFNSCGTVSGLLALLSVAVPLCQLAIVKRTWTELPAALAAGQSAIWNTTLFSVTAATFCLLICLVLASMRTRQKPTSSLFAPLMWLPFLVPGVLLGVVLIQLFNRPLLSFFYQSAGIVIVALVIRYFAPGQTLISHALKSCDRDLGDVAMLAGASRWQMFRHVHWPQISPHVAAAWYVIFLLCLWDVESIVLIVPPAGETMALRIFNLLHYGHNAQVNALCLTLLLVALAPLAIFKIADLFTPAAVRRFGPALGLALLLMPVLCSCEPRSAQDYFPASSRIFKNVQIVGTRGVGVGQFNKPRSVAVDARDNFYVVDMTGRVQKFSSNGVFMLSWQMPQTDLGKPKGMCRDRDGNIVLVEPHYQRVNHFSPDGLLVGQWGTRGTNAGEFILPRAVAINSHNEMFVSEYSILERVQRFRRTGVGPLDNSDVTADLAFGQVGNGPLDFNRPEGLCIDSQDNLYVADSCNHRIQVYSSAGKLLRSHGKAGSAPGELSYPYDICVDKEGRQYVCEFGNSRIQVFDAKDQPLEIIGGPGGEPGRFSNPWGVALDSAGNLYVADSQNHRVQKFIRSL